MDVCVYLTRLDDDRSPAALDGNFSNVNYRLWPAVARRGQFPVSLGTVAGDGRYRSGNDQRPIILPGSAMRSQSFTLTAQAAQHLSLR